MSAPDPIFVAATMELMAAVQAHVRGNAPLVSLAICWTLRDYQLTRALRPYI